MGTNNTVNSADPPPPIDAVANCNAKGNAGYNADCNADSYAECKGCESGVVLHRYLEYCINIQCSVLSYPYFETTDHALAGRTMAVTGRYKKPYHAIR